MDMSNMLGAIYNTMEKNAAATPTAEDLVKQADMQFFGELCRSQGINVEHLNDNQVADLFKVAMEVKAEKEEEEGKKPEGKKEEDKEKEAAAAKLAAANEEYMQKRAAHMKVAEADFMGRLMAHSFADEMKKIAGENPFGNKGAPPFGKKEEDKEGEEGKEGKKDGKKEEDKEKEASVRRAAELVAALEQSKQASAAAPTSGTSTPNFDEVAAYHAIDMLKAAGVDEKLAFSRVNAAYTLGFPESVKMASAATPEQALELRALEMCESAGFAVDWAQA